MEGNDSRKKLAYYTCFVGHETSIAAIIPPVPTDKYDCYYFTNNEKLLEQLRETAWISVKLDFPIYDSLHLNIMNMKPIRALAHTLKELEGYKYLCWFDTKLTINTEKVNDLVNYLETSGKKIVFSRHVCNNTSVWDEYNEAIYHDRYKVESEKYKKYIESKLREGYSEKLSIHYCCGFILRNMEDSRVIQFNEEWMKNIYECGIEDQISLQFVHQNYTEIIEPIPWKWCWNSNFI